MDTITATELVRDTRQIPARGRRTAARGSARAFATHGRDPRQLDLDRAQTAAAFGILATAVKQAGRSPRPRYDDLWIAAQAIERGFGLLTLNRPDFEGLPGLRLLPLAA